MTFHEWLQRQSETVQTWYRCDTAAVHNPGHPHHAGAGDRLKELHERYRKEAKASRAEVTHDIGGEG